MKFSLAVIATFLVYLGWLLFQPAPKVDVSVPIEISSRSVGPNETITLLTEYCATQDFKQKLEIQLLDVQNNKSAYTIYSIDEAVITEGCHTTNLEVSTARFKNFEIETGEYQLRVRAATKVNPIRTEITRYDSVTFKYTKE